MYFHWSYLSPDVLPLLVLEYYLPLYWIMLMKRSSTCSIFLISWISVHLELRFLDSCMKSAAINHQFPKYPCHFLLLFYPPSILRSKVVECNMVFIIWYMWCCAYNMLKPVIALKHNFNFSLIKLFSHSTWLWVIRLLLSSNTISI